MESLIEDSNSVSRRAHLGNFFLPWNNKRKSGDDGEHLQRQPKYKSALEYFKNELEEEQIRALYDIYRLDFEMGGYSASEYLASLP